MKGNLSFLSWCNTAALWVSHTKLTWLVPLLNPRGTHCAFSAKDSFGLRARWPFEKCSKPIIGKKNPLILLSLQEIRLIFLLMSGIISFKFDSLANLSDTTSESYVSGNNGFHFSLQCKICWPKFLAIWLFWNISMTLNWFSTHCICFRMFLKNWTNLTLNQIRRDCDGWICNWSKSQVVEYVNDWKCSG